MAAAHKFCFDQKVNKHVTFQKVVLFGLKNRDKEYKDAKKREIENFAQST